MTPDHPTYGMTASVPLAYDRAVAVTREELAKEGFGVLTEIDVRATMKQKLDVEFPPYIILGACNPPMAHQALTAERDIGLLLPCNVVVYEGADPSTSVVVAIDPVRQMELSGNEQIGPVADQVRAKLARVLQGVQAAT